MTSRAERRRLERELEETERLVRSMVGEARKIGLPLPSPPQIATRVFSGWEWCVSCCTHGVPGTENTIEHWHMSAMLYPAGRRSEPNDWRLLGYGVHLIHRTSGAEGNLPDSVTPIDLAAQGAPNRPHHWVWHGDGSPLSECGIERGKAFLDDIYREPDDEKRKRKLAQSFFSKIWKTGATKS